MKSRHIPETHLIGSSANGSIVRVSETYVRIAARLGIGISALLLFVVLASSSWAQAIRFRVPQYRVTVPLNSTVTTTVTNSINLSGVTNATFDISGLPTGAGAFLTDTNGAVITSVNGDTNLWLVVNTTNIAHGIYTFSLNASGFDTNGAPVTNNIFLLLQAAHVWNGAGGIPGSSNAWSQASSWLGGVPSAGRDVVFTDLDAQTNILNGFAVTNSYVDADTTVGSIRFSQTSITNSIASDADARPRTHSVFINPGRTLSITGTNGFSLLRDYIDDFQQLGAMTVNIFGGVGSKMVVSNASANFALMIGNSTTTDHPILNASNLNSMVMYVNRVGLGEFQLFPNYRHYNDAQNYNGRPSRYCLNFHMPRTNIVTALYKDPDGYTNELTRAYALTFLDSEILQVGSGVDNFVQLGQSNAFFMDSVCFIRANHSTGNNGFVRFNPAFPDGIAIFRSTNGGRMSLFAVSDDGGTGPGEGNVKANINFALNNGAIDLLTDKIIVARDRSIVASNHTVNVTGDLTLGRGTTDVNTVILGFQEASSKTNWYAIDPTPPDNAYLGYCRGNMFVTNGGVVRINRTLTLGYTADTNSVAAAQQYNTWGQLTINSNSTVMVSNVVVDSGLNYYDFNGRNNRITIQQGGTLILTNTIGAPTNLPLDFLTMTAGTLQMFVNPTRTNVFVRNLQNPGTTPSIIKVLSLTGITAYPTNIPLISYENASPFLAADMSLIGGGVQGYIINNTDNKTIDLFLTTNAPKNLVWRGGLNNQWDLTTKNWRLVGGSVDTNFAMGDIATFDDTALQNSIDITVVVVPNQTAGTNGVTVTNTVQNFTFNPLGGAIAGTAQFVKAGSGQMTFNAAEAGPINIVAGTVGGSGNLGATTVFSNAVLNFAGTINNGLTSTGTVVLTGTMASGALAVRGGTFDNEGMIITTVANGAAVISGGAIFTNGEFGEMDIDTGGNGNNWAIQSSTLANFGLIKNVRGRLNVGLSGAPFGGATLFGTGTVQDPDGGTAQNTVDGRVAINQDAVLSPGSAPLNSIGTFSADSRFDLNNTPASGFGTLLIEVDFNNPQTNDIVECDRWSNITGLISLTNINPGAGTFSFGNSFQIFRNNNGPSFVNTTDGAEGTTPLIQPFLPGPGLQWGTSGLRTYGVLTITNTPLIWNGNPGSAWDTNTANLNWQGGLSYFDNAGALFDDSASGTTTVILTTSNSVAPGGYAIQTNIVPNTSTNFFTNGPAMLPGIVVSNATKDYIFGGNGKISGITGLYKAGPGKLSILTTNDFTGATILLGGTVEITNANSLGVVNANGSRGVNTDYFIDGVILRYVGNNNGTLPRPAYINANSVTVDVISATNELTTAQIFGAGALTKIGLGSLAINQDASYSGGTIISNGTLRITSGSRIGTGPVTLAGGTLYFSGGVFTLTNALSVVGTGSRIINTNPYIASGLWSGIGALTISNSSTLSFSNSIAGYSGAITVSSTNVGNLRFNTATNANQCTGSAAASFDLGTGSASISNFNGAGLTYNLGSLSGGPNTLVAGRFSNATVHAALSTYSIGANGQSTVFSGRIVNGADTVSVVKVGAGTLALNGVNLYTGSTTVSNGTLGGNGAISGPLTVTAGGTLAPGTSVGKFTVNNSVTLSGTTVMELDQAGGTSTNDQVVANSITGGGTLIVTNIGPDLFNNTTFKLFSVPVSGFTTVSLPATGPSGPYVWTNTLSTDGSIKLLSGGTVNTNPPTITSFTSGGGTTLNLSWPADHTGWSLQVQTNAITVGISTNWTLVLGSSATNSAAIPINPAAPTVFYRLIYP